MRTGGTEARRDALRDGAIRARAAGALARSQARIHSEIRVLDAVLRSVPSVPATNGLADWAAALRQVVADAPAPTTEDIGAFLRALRDRRASGDSWHEIARTCLKNRGGAAPAPRDTARLAHRLRMMLARSRFGTAQRAQT